MKILEIICRVAGILAALLFTGAAIVITYEAVMRYSGAPTSWAQDLAIYFMIVGAFLSQAAVMLEDGHVRVDIFLSFVPDALRVLSIRITLAIGIIYVGIVTWESLFQAMDSYEIGRKSTSLFRIPTWIPESALPIGFGLLLIAILMQIRRPKAASLQKEIEQSLEI
jgi:TRAP-type C4-dicarboxylate transport system permease small subunit